MNSRRLTVADLPTFTIRPLGPTRPDLAAKRTRPVPPAGFSSRRLAWWQGKVLDGLAACGREMTHGELGFYFMGSLSSLERAAVLDGLVDEGKLLVRAEPHLGPHGESRFVYRLPSQPARQEGGHR
jgi:hypothetical protein